MALTRGLLGLVALGPAVAVAHVGDGNTDDFLHALLHPFTGLDHIIVAALLVLVTLRRHGAVAWLPGALFGSGVAMGYLSVLFGASFPFATPLTYVLMGVLTFSFVRPQRVIPALCLTTVTLLGLSQGHAHALGIQSTDPTQCLCGIALALGSLALAGVLAGPLLLVYRKLSAPTVATH